MLIDYFKSIAGCEVRQREKMFKGQNKVNRQEMTLEKTDRCLTFPSEKLMQKKKKKPHLLLFLLFGNLQCWWVGKGGGFTVGAVLHLGHLSRRTDRSLH